MGREQRRKKAKKEGLDVKKETKQMNTNNGRDAYNLLRVLLIVLGILVVIYLFVAIFITKEIDTFSKSSEDKKTSESNNEVNNSILASEIFKQSEEIYYVYFYDFDVEKNSLADRVLNNLSDYKVFKVDTGSALNANYIKKEGNKNATSLEDLQVKNPTLIKIVSENITEYYDGKEEISNYLN